MAHLTDVLTDDLPFNPPWHWEEGAVPYRYTRETFGRFFETYDDINEDTKKDLVRVMKLYRSLVGKICIEMNCFSRKKRYNPADYINEDRPELSLRLTEVINKDFPRNIVLARIAFLFSVFLRNIIISATVGKLLINYLSTYLDDIQQIESRLIHTNRYYYAPKDSDQICLAVPRKHLDKYVECVNYYAQSVDSIIGISAQLREFSREITGMMRVIVVSPPV